MWKCGKCLVDNQFYLILFERKMKTGQGSLPYCRFHHLQPSSIYPLSHFHPHLPTFPAQTRQLTHHEILRVHQIGAAVHHPPPRRTPRSRPGSHPPAAARPTVARPLRPVLQVAVLIHAPASDRKNNRLAEPLPSLPKTRSRPGSQAAQGPWHPAQRRGLVPGL